MVAVINICLFILIASYHVSVSESQTTTSSSTVDENIAAVQSFLTDVDLPNIIPALLLAEDTDDKTLTVPQLIKKYGYEPEIHTVTTEDQYILEMHRISGSKKFPPKANKPVVFLQHGLLSSSADWIIMGPESSIGYLLADEGYDVWMGNGRGSTYSKKHAILSPSDSKFWDFSWNEMGMYDIPAEIDYVLANTNQKDLIYIGHSMGTTMFYVMASSLPQYNSKIRLMTSLAPIAFMGYVPSPISKFLSLNPLTQPLVAMLGIREFMPGSGITETVIQNLCSSQSIVEYICSSVIFAICGYDPQELNMTKLPVLLSHAPAGASAKSFLHYAQSMASGQFRRWDYGFLLNLYHYGQFSPPAYDLSSITTPVWLVYSDNDWYGDPKDVEILNKTLPTSQGMYRVPLDSFNHVDFVWATHVKNLLNDKIIDFIKNY